MARIRTIKPSAFTSESLAKVSVAARWTFAGLWTYVDDEGRGKAEPRLVKGAIWPLDDDVTPKDVAGYLDELEAEECIERYEIDGREYLQVMNWHHQSISRPTESRIPGPPDDPGTLTEPSRSVQGDLLEASAHFHAGSGSGSGTGNKEGGTGTLAPDDSGESKPSRPKTAAQRQREAEAHFVEWWKVYPKRKNRPKALAAYANAIQKIDPDELMRLTRVFVHFEQHRDPKFTPHPATWLNGERWADDPDEERKPPGGNGNVQIAGTPLHDPFNDGRKSA